MNTRRTCNGLGPLAALALFSTGGLASAAIVNIPPVEVFTLDHTYSVDPFFCDTFISDGVLFPCDPGDCSGPGFTATFGTGDTIIARFEAQAGKTFVVTKSELVNQLFLVRADWFTGVGDVISNTETGTVTFENLFGTPPVSTFNQNFVSNNGEAIGVNQTFNVVGDFEFTAMQVEFVITHALPSVSRTYMPVTSSSSPSFASSVFVFATGSCTSISDHVLMEIVAASPNPFSLLEPAPGGYVTTTEPTLVWTVSTTAASYTVTIDDDADLSSPLLVQRGIVTESFSVPGGTLAPGIFYWQVVATNGFGSTPSSPNPADFAVILPDCLHDTDGDGGVGINDFLALLANWGPCP